MKKQTILCLLLFLHFLTRSQVEKNMTAKFTFNEGKAVNEVNGNMAKPVGVLFVDDRFGNPRSACYMHGSPGSYLNLGNSPDLKFTKGTISLWVKIDIAMQAGAGYQFNPILLTKNGESDDFYEAYAIAYDFKVEKIVTATSLSGELQVVLNSANTFTLNQWHHIAISFDNERLRFYFDGKKESSIAKNFETVYSKTDSVMVGNSANQKNARYLCGAVDDILFFNRVLSDEEVERLFKSPNPNRFSLFLAWLYKILALVVFVLLLVWFILRRYKKALTLQQQKNELMAHLNELETKAIRTQMNPHFIFNALNTLQRFILEEDIPKANSYLIRFSKLLRKLLESSSSESINLKEEIEIIKNYIEIEKLRFSSSFEFNIECNLPHPEKVHIPFMLVQPFVENAIWHGLLAKKDLRILSIRFELYNNQSILCRVEDNGVGRKYSLMRHDPFKKKSMALDFTKQRLEILQKSNGIPCSYTIIDKTDSEGLSAGTLVEIIIPILKPNDKGHTN